MNILAQIHEQEFTADNQVPQGFLYASVKNIGRYVATVNGVQLSPGEAKDYPFIGKGYQGFTFEVNGSTLRILYVM